MSQRGKEGRAISGQLLRFAEFLDCFFEFARLFVGEAKIPAHHVEIRIDFQDLFTVLDCLQILVAEEENPTHIGIDYGGERIQFLGCFCLPHRLGASIHAKQ